MVKEAWLQLVMTAHVKMVLEQGSKHSLTRSIVGYIKRLEQMSIYIGIMKTKNPMVSELLI